MILVLCYLVSGERESRGWNGVGVAGEPGARLGSVRDPFGIRAGSVRGAFGVRAGSVRGPCGVRAGSVRSPFGVRSGSVRGPYGVHTGSVRGPYELRLGFPMQVLLWPVQVTLDLGHSFRPGDCFQQALKEW